MTFNPHWLNEMLNIIRVAAAAIENSQGEILLAKRPPHKHKGDLWEFPGGKVEANESDEAALIRELQEELNITPTEFEPLISLIHHYPEKSVELIVFRVKAFAGEIHANEQQPLTWVKPELMSNYAMPEADVPIVNALKLPPFIAITPRMSDNELFYSNCERVLNSYNCFLQLRDHNIEDELFCVIAQKLIQRLPTLASRIVLNRAIERVQHIASGGTHLTSSQLMTSSAAKISEHKTTHWLSASCHSETELKYAQAMGLDYCFLSPVQSTPSHPEQVGIGWAQFESLKKTTTLPVYALGGLAISDLDAAKAHGAQGVAGISAFES